MRLFLLLTLLSVGVFGQQLKMSVEDLKKFIESTVKLHQNDREVSVYLKRVKMTEKLSDRDIEEMRSYGTPARIMDAVRLLRDASGGLPEPAEPKRSATQYQVQAVAPPPAPDSVEQAKVLANTREYALSYIKKLPDFICAQITRRYYDPTGHEDFRLIDKINEQLTFFEQHESYKVSSINDRFVTMEHDQLDGASSSGEFGSMLKEIFAPETRTDFQWERWATLRGRRMHVFSFRVTQSRSQYRIIYRRSQQLVAGYRGLIYVDRESGAVMRVKLECENLPADFPIQEVALDLNYGFENLSGVEFVLPLKAELRSREGRIMVKNEVEFRLYRKFGSEATIKFDAIEPLPEETTKEQPPTAAPAKPAETKTDPKKKKP